MFRKPQLWSMLIVAHGFVAQQRGSLQSLLLSPVAAAAGASSPLDGEEDLSFQLKELEDRDLNRQAARERRLSFVSQRAAKRRNMIDAQREMRRRTTARDKKPRALPLTRSLASLRQGEWLEGVVRKTRTNGAFVTVGTEIDGFLHVKDLSETKFVDDADVALKRGDQIKVCVKWADPATTSLALSMIPLERTDSYLAARYSLTPADFTIDQHLENATILRVTPFAAFLDVGCTVPAYLHVADIGLKPRTRIGAKREPIVSPQPGLTITSCWVKSVDCERKRIRVTCIPPHLRDDPSIKSLPKRPYFDNNDDGIAT